MESGGNGAEDAADLAGLGAFVRERRRALCISQSQLGKRLGWTQERISILENAKYGMPSVHKLARLASALDTSLRDILQAAGLGHAISPSLSATDLDEPTAVALLYTLERLFTIQAPSLKASLDQAVDMVGEVIGAEKVDVLLYEPQVGSLVALSSSNTELSRREAETGMNRLPLVQKGREVEVFETGKPYRTADARSDSEMLQGFTEGLGIQSMITVPIEVAGKREGVLVAGSSHIDAFTDDDLPFLETVARWVGMVAQRAQLMEQIATASRS